MQKYKYSCVNSYVMSLKQVILVRKDLKLPKGKLSTQVAHASTESALISDKDIVSEWRSEGMKKVVLKVKDLKELRMYQQLAKDENLVAAMITDAGKTVVAPGTATCVGIGPDDEEKIDTVTGKLKMLWFFRFIKYVSIQMPSQTYTL